MDTFTQLNVALSGRYEVEREIGAGGMATVYLARDVRHDRHVALKILKPELGAVLGVERFLSEIRVTANLQHPNLLALFDSGEAAGQLFYVMPYVEGESLRARLDREKQLPIDDALHVATSVASALDYAHRHGVIHRDLKPENILLHEGQPVIADFGIALAVSNAGGNRITQTGLSLGTPQYMSPEQATGDRQIDGRTDIYSLGAVLYEMLAGEPPHIGNTAQAIIARVLIDRPRGVRVMRPSIPEHVEAAVQRALEKLPADRWPTAKDFAEAIAGRAVTPPARDASRDATMRHLRARGRDPLVIGLLAALLAALWVVTTLLLRPPGRPLALPVYLSIESSNNRKIIDGFPAVSTDGRRLAFIAESAGVPRLYTRGVDQFDARVVPGTEQIYNDSPPFFSPDGEWIAFVSDHKLKRARIGGTETPEIIGDASDLSTGGSWGSDGSIVFAPDVAKGLVRFPAGGGQVEVLTLPNRAAGEIGYGWPEVLPNAKAVLYGLITRNGWSVGVRSLVSNRQQIILPGATMAHYVSTGHLIYVKAGRLYSVPFDADRLTIDTRVAPRPLAVTVTGQLRAGGLFDYYAVSPSGSLVFVGGERHIASAVVRVDRSGTAIPVREGSGAWPRISPRGDAVLVGDSAQIWLFDLTHGGARTRLTDGPPRYVPLWSPDGQRMVYTSYQDGPANLYMSTINNPSESRRLVAGDSRRYAGSWSRDGSLLAFGEVGNPGTGSDLWVLPLSGDKIGEPIAALRTEANEYHPAFSRDGKLLAYASDRTGRPEVYVQGFPEAGTPRRVSPNGGDAPVWNPNGRELFFRDGNQLMAVPVTPATPPQFGEPRKLFELRFDRSTLSPSYDVSPDGQWFMVETVAPVSSRRIDVIVNWRP